MAEGKEQSAAAAERDDGGVRAAQLSGLQEDHTGILGTSWHPFGQHDEHAEAVKELSQDDDDDDDDKKRKENKSNGKGGLGGGIVAGFKKMGNALRGGKSHRFTDLLHLHREVKRDLTDVKLYPELERDAELRRTNTLCEEEARFVQARKQFIVQSGALKRFLQLEEADEIHPDDVPIIGLGGSGGGYRACLGFLAYIEEMQNAMDAADKPSDDMWSLCTYVAGVSGSCWSIAGLYSVAKVNATLLLDRFAKSSSHHPLSMTAIDAVARSANGIYFQLAPILQKIRVGHLHPGPLDLYGTLVTSHIFFEPMVIKDRTTTSSSAEKEEPRVALQRDWFRFSQTYKGCALDKGVHPMPILTAVRHERPWRDWTSEEEAFGRSNHQSDEHQNASHAWWQWFEFTPLEFGSDELEGWIPTWSFGRTFDKGKSTQRLPERSLSLLLGICTSAPAGPLAAWLATIYRNLPHGALGNRIRRSADEWVEKHPKQAERLQAHHPVHAMNEPNPFFGAEKQENRGQGFENSPRIHMVDAGMSNNLPHYTFFRPGRQVDLMLLGDFSSDVQGGAALERIEQFGREKGVTVTQRTPLPALAPWPQEEVKGKEEGKTVNKTLTADEIQERFAGRYAQVLDVRPVEESQRTEEEGPTYVDPNGIKYNHRHQPQATNSTTMIYLPLLPNACQPAYDPSTAPFSSSYNLVWSEEEVQTIRTTARANIRQSLDTIRATLREIYMNKRCARLARESKKTDELTSE